MIKTRVRNSFNKKNPQPPKQNMQVTLRHCVDKRSGHRTQKKNVTVGSGQRAQSGDRKPACGWWYNSFYLWSLKKLL